MKITADQYRSIIEHDLDYFVDANKYQYTGLAEQLNYREFEDWEEDFISWLGSHYPNESKHRKSN